jgi:hypothetical protein
MATGLLERKATYHYKLRAQALLGYHDHLQRLLGKQLLDGRAYVVICGSEFTVLDMAHCSYQEMVVQRSLVTLKHYEDAQLDEYVDFDALIATDRQLGVVMPHLNEHWIFGIEYFDLGPGTGTVKCWRRRR